MRYASVARHLFAAAAATAVTMTLVACMAGLADQYVLAARANLAVNRAPRDAARQATAALHGNRLYPPPCTPEDGRGG